MLSSVTKVSFLIASLFGVNCYANTMQDVPAIPIPEDTSEEWSLDLGLAAFFLPEYEGAEDSEGVGLPYINARYGDKATINIFNGLDYNFVSHNGLTLGVGVGIDFGRAEDKSDVLTGLGDIDLALEPKVYIANRMGRFSTKLTLSSDASGDGHDGMTVDIDASYFVPLSNGAIFIPGIAVNYGNDDYMQSYFGITEQQSIDSEDGLAEFEAKAGVKSVAINLVYVTELTKKWSMIGIVQAKSILGDIKDSPLVKEDGQTLIGGMVYYKF